MKFTFILERKLLLLENIVLLSRGDLKVQGFSFVKALKY